MVEAELHKDFMIIKDQTEANQIHNKGYFGDPKPGGSLRLQLVEGVFLIESGRLEVSKNGKKMSFLELLKLANMTQPTFEIKYLVYRDLRLRGYVVKSGLEPLDFRVFPRGGTPSKTPSKYWVSAFSERSSFDISELRNHLAEVSRAKKKLLVAVVDEESDLTYYEARIVSPKGKRRLRRRKKLATATLLDDRVLVSEEEQALRLHELGYFGRMIGSSLQLSLIETAFLLEKGIIEVRNAATGRKIGLRYFIEKARRLQPDFNLRLKVFKDLEERGLVVKTGFKYGSHFRAYTDDPRNTHAQYLVHSLPQKYRGMWPEVSRAIRVAHGVKKDILFGAVGRKIEYISLCRVRP